MQSPHRATPSGTRKAQDSHRGAAALKRWRQRPQMRSSLQSWQMAHCVGSVAALRRSGA
jgi:hypothetical protein